MKKYLLILAISLVGFGVLGYLYFRSQSDFNKDHQEILQQFSKIQQSDMTLNKEVLSVQYFLSQSDIGLDQPTKDIQDFCDLTVMQYFFDSRSLRYDDAFNKFCHEEDIKLKAIKTYREKSQNYRKAVLQLQAESVGFLKNTNTKK